jgi:hypothetical protein
MGTQKTENRIQELQDPASTNLAWNDSSRRLTFEGFFLYAAGLLNSDS